MMQFRIYYSIQALVISVQDLRYKPNSTRFNPLQSTMSFPYKHILIIGATAGIGRALASRLVQSGAKVTVVGRRKERLDEFVQEHGEDKANAVQFDIGDLDKIPGFAAE